MRNGVLTIIILSVTSTSALALTSTQKERTLVVHHAMQRVTGEPDSAKVEPRSLAATMPYTMRHDEQLKVVVDDPNPLVFTYTWKGVTKSNTRDYSAALAALDSVRALAAGFARFDPERPQAAGANAGSIPRVGEALDAAGVSTDKLTQLARDLETLSNWAAQIPQLTSDSAGSKQAAQNVKDDVMRWNVAEVATRAQKTMSEFETATRTLLTALAVGTVPTTGVVTNPNQPLSSSPSALTQGSSGTQAAGSTGSGTTTTNPPTPPPPPTPTVADALAANDRTARDLRQFATFMLSLQQSGKLTELVTGLTAFRENVSRINERLSFGPVEYSSTQDSTATFEIGAATGAASADVAKRPTGTFAFVITPYSPAALRTIAPAMIYSFVEAPEYGTRQLGNGNYQIIREDSGNDVNGLTLGVMLELSPQSWNNPTVGGGFQVGISPVQDRLGVFAGGVLRLFDLFAIGGGLAYQQTERLASGLREDQDDLTSADQLRTRTHFTPGAYLSITVKLD